MDGSKVPLRDHPLRLRDFYRACRRHFGYADPWWPGTTAEIVVTSILVQQCDWSTAYQGAKNLTASNMAEVHQLSRASVSAVRQQIGKVNLAPTKAERLVRLAQRLEHHHRCQRFADLLHSGMPTPDLRCELLNCRGIGPETADSILAFASDRPRFVVDESCRRVFERLQLFPGVDIGFWRKSYPRLQQFFDDLILPHLHLYDDFDFPPHLPRETALMRDFHAQILELARHHCVKTGPRCNAPGKHGWSDYPICRSHCLPGRCSACPLVEHCAVGAHSLD